MPDIGDQIFNSGQEVDRRTALRRGAIIGGTLIWAAPVIQSLTPAAFAQTRPHRTCCSCKTVNPTGGQCQQDGFTRAQCDSYCGGADNVEAYVQEHECDANNDCVPITP